MADVHNPVLGYSLHLRANQLIEDFLKEVEDNFQYLDEILAEVKEHFGRRDSVVLLPKTPCMKKAKRRRVERSLDNSIESHSNITPEKGKRKVKADSLGTPDSKKPAISPVTAQSPTEIPDTKQANGNGRMTRARASKNKKLNEILEVSIQEKGKARGNGQKKQSKGKKRQLRERKSSSKQVKTQVEADDKARKEDIPKGPRTRNKRKQDEADVPVAPVKMPLTQDDSEKQSLQCVAKKSKISVSPAKYKRKQDKADVPVAPVEMSLTQDDSEKQSLQCVAKKSKISVSPAKYKRKQDEADVPVAPVEMSLTQDDSEKQSLQCVAKKSKISVSPAKYNETPLPVEVFIPETPNVQHLAQKIFTEKPKAAKSSFQNVLLTPTSVAEPHEIESGLAEGENGSVNPVVIVEAIIAYENQEQVNKTPEQELQEEVISEPTVSSTIKKISSKKTRSRSSRSSSGGCKRKLQDDDKEVVKDSSVITSISTNNEVETGESVPKIQKVDHSVSDEVVSSTVDLPDESQRKSIHLSRNTRTSSRLSVQAAKKQQKSKSRKSRGLVKSSVMIKLSPKKIMPGLTPEKHDVDDNDDAESLSNTIYELNNVKQNLFEDEENDDKGEMDPVEEICEAHSSTPVKTTEDSAEENDDTDEAEDEEFHDAAEIIDEEIDGADYHDAPETTEEADDQKDAISRPTTRSSSRNQNRGSQSSYDGDRSLTSESGSNLSQCSENETEGKGPQSSNDANRFNMGPKVIKNPAVVIHSFIKRNTPKKVDSKERSRMMKMAILERQEKEKERIEQLELLKQKRIEDQKRKRQEKERKAAELRAAKAREEQEKREQMEKKLGMRKQLEEKARKEKEKEEEMKRKARLQKKAELDARRKQEEEQRQQKIQEKEDEARRHQDMLRRKAEFEEQERQRKIMEAKRQQELREQELEREREQEKLRLLREIEEKERKLKEEREKAEKKIREEKEKEEKERKRIAQLLREKEENERKEREKKAKAEERRQEREATYRDELEKERKRQRRLEEQRIEEEARLKPLPNTDSYEMTPPPPPRICRVTSQNYNIDDICSDDSTDDEDAPKKKIPSWAEGAKLKAALINQAMGKFDVEAIFGGVVMPNLDEIFTHKKKRRFYQRTSSAHWDSPPLKRLNR